MQSGFLNFGAGYEARTRYLHLGKVARLFGCRAVATHAYLPLLLDDNDPAERELALEFGIKLLATCDALIVCGARITSGMAGEIKKAMELGIPILFLEDFV